MIRVDTEVKKKYFEVVNMTLREFKAWSKKPCSKKASLDRKPIVRNLRLLSKRNERWTDKDLKDALKTISFIKRMKKVKAGPLVKGCGLSKRTISLMNWGYNPNKK